MTQAAQLGLAGRQVQLVGENRVSGPHLPGHVREGRRQVDTCLQTQRQQIQGQKQVLEMRIEPDVFASKDQEMLQDLIRAAVNEASRRVDDELAEQMKSLAGGIPGIPGMKIPGLF